MALNQKRHVQGPPDLAIEIVSPESVELDYEKKRKQRCVRFLNPRGMALARDKAEQVRAAERDWENDERR